MFHTVIPVLLVNILTSQAQNFEYAYEDPTNQEAVTSSHIEDDEFLHIRLINDGVEWRTSISDRSRLWKNGIVPYQLSEKFGYKGKERMEEASDEFLKYTCIYFVPRTEQKQYLLIEPGKGCISDIGMNTDTNETATSLSESCFFGKMGVLLHELMHALGFIHEHNRPDRDNYVKVFEENIEEGKKLQFEKYKWEEVDTFNVTYDYESLMHYGPYVFSKDRFLPTMLPLEEGVTIGQREGFSPKDILKLNLRYNCYQ